jgi:hypothetical protein
MNAQPGFTAESSIYKSSQLYRSTGLSAIPIGIAGIMKPQFAGLPVLGVGGTGRIGLCAIACAMYCLPFCIVGRCQECNDRCMRDCTGIL